jgi:hypothetical protein
MNIAQVLKSINDNKVNSPQSAAPYPIVGVLEDGTILQNGAKGGVYEETGLKWDIDKNLEEQSDEVKTYFSPALSGRE